jgi:NTE family protein
MCLPRHTLRQNTRPVCRVLVTRQNRVTKLREFWELVSRSPFGFDGALGPLLATGDAARAFAQQMSAVTATVLGVPGFYAPRIPSVLFQPPGTLEATSFYDTTLLKKTLERLVDFELINASGHDVRLTSAASMREVVGLSILTPRRISSGPSM